MLLPSLQIQTIQIPAGKRILVTSDIHGHDKRFQTVLEMAKFSAQDILIIVGDIIEKGPESLKTLRSVMDLSKKGNVIPLIGNVDAWRLHMIHDMNEESAADFLDYLHTTRRSYGSSFFDEMTAELGFICETPDELLSARAVVTQHFETELQFLASLPTVLETQNYIFVHGGLPHQNLDAATLHEHDLFDFLKLDHFILNGLCFEKYVVVGHWPVTLYPRRFPDATPIVNREQKIISLDGGCGIKSDGQLNLMVIPHIDCSIEAVEFIYCDDFPVLTALSNQNASADSVYITWLDNKIKVLQKDGDFTSVTHLSTNTTLCVPTDSIYANDTRMGDYTDYALPVKKGDKLSLIKKTGKGYLVKKDGVTGWYYGDIE